jgi:RNA polymerase sigma-70 factor (ECF subfamily)
MEANETLAQQERCDEEWLRQIAAGKQEALAPLHRRYAPIIFNLGMQTLDQAAAEEIVQDVFIAVWNKATMFDPERGTCRAWILRIAHLRILNELRRRNRRPRAVPDPDGLRLTNLPDPDPEPAELAWQEYRRTTVRAAVATLPSPQRQALSLAFFEDLTHEQVSEFLKVPLGTVKTRIRAGLQKLRPYLTSLIVVAVTLGGIGAGIALHTRAEDAGQARDERALRLVTTSDVVPVRLVAANNVPTETHANYRSRPGATIAVMTTSFLDPTPAGQRYQAWVFNNGYWVSLGVLQPDSQGTALLIAEGDALATPPERLEVTLEPLALSVVPTGPVVLAWASP